MFCLSVFLADKETNFPQANGWSSSGPVLGGGSAGGGTVVGGGGGLGNLDLPRKPLRLEALPMQRPAGNKKKKNKSNTDLSGSYTY